MTLFNLWQLDKAWTVMNNQFADNPFYVQYEALLIELHHLIAAGKGNEDESDAVRDEMDGPEQKLT